MNPKVDFFFDKAGRWESATRELRRIILDCGLVEELKWGVPCYTVNKHNVVLIHHFKEYCAVLFHQGALLDDTAGILIQQTENVQAARQVRFTGVAEVLKTESVIVAYVAQAVENEVAGRRVEMKKTTAFETPDEFEQRMAELPALRAAFGALTPGRQRGYLLYFSSAKQAKTREARIDKHVDRILDGFGLED